MVCRRSLRPTGRPLRVAATLASTRATPVRVMLFQTSVA